MKTKLRLIGGKRLESPKNIYTRPTTLRVREAIFNILSKILDKNLNTMYNKLKSYTLYWQSTALTSERNIEKK